MVNKESILGALKKKKTREVDVDGVKVLVREMTGDEYVGYFDQCGSIREAPVEDANELRDSFNLTLVRIHFNVDSMAEIAARHIVDEQGGRIFSDDDIPMLKTECSRTALKEVQDAVFELSGITFQDAPSNSDEELEMSEPEKNFDEVPSDFSHTASL